MFYKSESRAQGSEQSIQFTSPQLSVHVRKDCVLMRPHTQTGRLLCVTTEVPFSPSASYNFASSSLKPVKTEETHLHTGRGQRGSVGVQKCLARLDPQHHTGCVMPVKSLSTQEMEVGGSEGYPELHSKLEVSLGYVSPHLKK